MQQCNKPDCKMVPVGIRFLNSYGFWVVANPIPEEALFIYGFRSRVIYAHPGHN